MNSPQPDTRQIIFDALRVSWNDRVLEEAVTWPEAEAVLEALRAAGGVVVYPNHPDTIEAVAVCMHRRAGLLGEGWSELPHEARERWLDRAEAVLAVLAASHAEEAPECQCDSEAAHVMGLCSLHPPEDAP